MIDEFKGHEINVHTNLSKNKKVDHKTNTIIKKTLSHLKKKQSNN